MKKKPAFTLVELLVVISIIAMLLAILIPSLNKAKKLASSVVCRSNLKQWGVINQMYINSNNGKFPEDRLGITDASWVWILRPYYMNMPEIRYCPTAKKHYLQPQAASSTQTQYDTKIGFPFGAWGPYPNSKGLKEYGSYGFNTWLYNWPADRNPDQYYQREKYWGSLYVRGQASNVPLMGDCAWRTNAPQIGDVAPAKEFLTYNNVLNDLIQKQGTALGRYCVNRHGGTMNMVFCDLSARRVGLKELWKLKYHPLFDTNRGPGGEWPTWMRKFKD